MASGLAEGTRPFRQRGTTAARRCALLTMLAAAACHGRPKATHRQPGSHDSAGVAVVELPAAIPAGTPEWVGKASTPIVIDSTRKLNSRFNVQFLPDGRVLASVDSVKDTTLQAFHVFSPQGKELDAFGNTSLGQRRIVWLSFPVVSRDTIYAYDLGTARSLVFDRRGQLLSAGFVAILGDLIGHVSPKSWVAFRSGDNSMRRGHWRDTAVVFLQDSAGTISVIAKVAGTEYDALNDQYRASPFTKQASVWFSDSLVYVSDQDAYEIRVVGLDGRLRRIIRRDVEPVEVTSSLISGFKDAARKWAGNPESLRLTESFLAVAQFPKSLPAFSSIQLDNDGNLWIRDYDTALKKKAVWLVVGPDGQIRATARVDLEVGEIVYDASPKGVLVVNSSTGSIRLVTLEAK